MKLVTFGRLASEFQEYLTQNHPSIEVVLPDSPEELLEELVNADTYAGFDYLQDGDLSSLSWIHSFAAGVESFVERELPEDLVLTRTTGNLGQKIGEYCLTYILLDLRNAFQTFDNQRRKHWEQQSKKKLADQNVLVLGTGSMGSGIAAVLKNNDMTVYGVSRSGRPHEEFDKVYTWQDLETLGHPIDVIINALPDTPQTRQSLGIDFFSQFKGIHFINIGRGITVKENELLVTLESDAIRHATLDVFETEPLPKSSTLWEHPKVIVTPHQSGVTTIDDVIPCFEEAYRAISTREDSRLIVNLQNGY